MKIENPPKISIITPSYNQEKFIAQTIESVVNQHYPNLEYIVIDGKSTDNSLDIIKKYDDKISYWVSEPDKGHGNALNKGFAKSSGEIMAWINSDDLYMPWTLKTVAEVFTAFPEVDWIVGISSFIRNGGIFNVDRIYKNIYDYLIGDFQWIQQESVFWRRSLWEKAGGHINEDMKLMVDGELWCRFFRHAKLHQVNTILAGYRAHENNRAFTHYDDCLMEMKTVIADLKKDLPADKKKHLKQIRRLQKMNFNIHHRNLKSARTRKISTSKVITKKLFKALDEETAYHVLTPNRDGSWTKSEASFFIY